MTYPIDESQRTWAFFAGGPVFDLVGLPTAVFEPVLGPWLLMKGVNTDRGATSEPRPTIGATT